MHISSLLPLMQHLRRILPLVFVTFGLTHVPHAFALGGSPEPTKQRIVSIYRSLPLSFEGNQGQADGDVRFLSHGAGYSIFFKDREAVLLLSKKRSVGKPSHSSGLGAHVPAQREEVNTDVVQMRLINAGNPMLTGEERLPGTVNYFVGNDAAQWHTGVSTFEKVRYRGVYPGVDLVYYGNSDRLEFDFELAAGADPRNVRIRFDGARKLTLDREGNLEIAAANGAIRFHKPAIYQPTDGNGRHAVEGSFRIIAGTTVSFNLGSYDRSKPLVIDPILNYSTYLGKSGQANAIVLDSEGNAYVTGWAGAAMPVTAGAVQSAPVHKVSGGTYQSVFVAKLNSTGTGIIYCTYLSGNGDDVANAIAVDAQGNAYLAGSTSSTNFPTTQSAFQTTNNIPPASYAQTQFPLPTGFVAEINSTGTALVYSTYLGGSATSEITGMALDAQGNAYVTGATDASDFPVTQGAFQSVSNISTDQETGFVSKVNSTGTGLVFSTYLGGSKLGNPLFYGANNLASPAGIALDASGNAYVTGATGSADFPTTPGAFQLTNDASEVTAFLTKINPTATGLVYSTFLGGTYWDDSLAVSVDSSGDAYLTGFTGSTDFPVTAGVFQPSVPPYGEQVAFVAKFNATGAGLIYSSFLGGEDSYNPPYATGTAIAVDGSGDAFVTGNTDLLDFPVTAGAFELENRTQLISGDDSSFLTKVNPAGTQLLYSTYLSGSGDGSGDSCDCAYGITLDSSGNPYIAGTTSSTDFQTTLGAFQGSITSAASSSNQIFVTQFNESEMKTLPATTTTVTSSVNPQLPGVPVTFTARVQNASGSVPTGTVGFSASYSPADPFTTSYFQSPWTTVPLDGAGMATYTTSSLQDGQNPIFVYYLGDAVNAPSSGSFMEVIASTFTTVTLTASTNPAPYGVPVVFTATVLDTAGNPATGDVNFLSVGANGENLGGSQMDPLNSAGQATWTAFAGYIGGLPVGVDQIQVQFIPAEASVEINSASISEIVTAAVGVTPAPILSPAGGTYTSAQQVTMSDANPAAVIYYVEDSGTNGLQPNPNISPVYASPISVTASQTVEALAMAPGYMASPVVSADYVINLPVPDFTETLSPTSLTVTGGGTATTQVSIAPLNGFNQAVSFACSGLPAGASCSFSPSTVTPGGASISTTLTVATSSNVSSRGPARMPFVPVTSVALALGWFGFRKRWPQLFSLFIVAVTVGLFSLSACGGSGSGGGGGGQNPPPTPTTSTVTVIATSGALSHTATLTLTVN